MIATTHGSTKHQHCFACGTPDAPIPVRDDGCRECIDGAYLLGECVSCGAAESPRGPIPVPSAYVCSLDCERTILVAGLETH